MVTEVKKKVVASRGAKQGINWKGAYIWGNGSILDLTWGSGLQQMYTIVKTH